MAAAVVLSVSALVSLSACSQGSNDSASTSEGADNTFNSGGSAGSGSDVERGGEPNLGGALRDSPSDAQSLTQPGTAQAAGPGASKQAELIVGESLIKTGAVVLQSDDIGEILTRVYSLVGAAGGDIAKEDTTTDDKGEASRSTLVLRVPVDEFDTSLDQLADLGSLVSKVRNSKDVTAAVADIDSRVSTAERSIQTLRSLFSRATALGDIIRLESELSQREADLESLQSQQRALADKTTMSTITVSVELPPDPVKPKPKHDQDDTAGGFVAGIHQGWDALRSTTVAVGHGLGVVLPIGTVLLLLAGAAFWLVRRWTPHHAPASKEA